MSLRRWFFAAKAWAVYQLDKFVAWPPIPQLLVLVLSTVVLILIWALIAVATEAQLLHGENPGWWALTRFMDGGVMAGDAGRGLRLLAVGVSASGVLLLSLMTGAFASKLSDRLEDIRTGKSPIVERGHTLILGFDSKVPLIARELARAHRRLTLVTLGAMDKTSQERQLRSVRRIKGSRVRTIARTGDARNELSLLRVAADRAARIIVLAPQTGDDDSSMRWTLSTLLALRRVTGPKFRGKIIAEVRRQQHCRMLQLAADAGLAGDRALDVELIASDDIIARVLAQSARHGAVYLALRELLSFSGSELYLEPVPRNLVGKAFEEAHQQIVRGIVVGVRTEAGEHQLSPRNGLERRLLQAGDKLIVLEAEEGDFELGDSLPLAAPPPLKHKTPQPPQTIAILGSNRTLPCLINELDRIMPAGSKLRLSCPPLDEHDQSSLAEAAARCTVVKVERMDRQPSRVGRAGDPVLAGADGVVLLGCEDPSDPFGDASALSLLLELRDTRRSMAQPPKQRIITEVHDPTTALQIGTTFDDFLVSTDVVAMMLAHVAFDPELTSIYRELLDPTGVELSVRDRRELSGATFGQVMAEARARGEVAIGYYPRPQPKNLLSGRALIEQGLTETAQPSVVHLNPPRDTVVPNEPGAGIIVIAAS